MWAFCDCEGHNIWFTSFWRPSDQKRDQPVLWAFPALSLSWVWRREWVLLKLLMCPGIRKERSCVDWRVVVSNLRLNCEEGKKSFLRRLLFIRILNSQTVACFVVEAKFLYYFFFLFGCSHAHWKEAHSLREHTMCELESEALSFPAAICSACYNKSSPPLAVLLTGNSCRLGRTWFWLSVCMCLYVISEYNTVVKSLPEADQ